MPNRGDVLITDHDTLMLKEAIHRTVRYFDLFEQPVTAVQVWRTLLVSEAGSHERWGGHRVWSLVEVQATLQALVVAGELEMQWGYYCRRHRRHVVALRLRRHALAQLKWKLMHRLTYWLQLVPFVRGLAMSGSLATGNTRSTSDLDVFVIARHGRIWLVRLGLLAVTHLLGRRRRHWDYQAPDKICLNHYVTDTTLLMPRAVRNLYTAVAYHHLIPLFGWSAFLEFWAVNDRWIKQYIMYAPTPPVPSRHVRRQRAIGRAGVAAMERLLGEPLFDFLEHLAERMQRSVMARHIRRHATVPTGRVVLSATELAFHPNTKVPAILARFAQDEGQQQLL